jgi:serine/threonine protein kinase
MKLVANSDGNWMIVKTGVGPREADALKRLNHPLIIGLHKQSPGAIVTEFAPNGSLADHLAWMKGADLCGLRGPTRITMIIAGIALAMYFVHGCGVAHCALSPAHIFLDWDWTVRIGGFGQSIFIEDPSSESQQMHPWPPGDFRFLAPECYENGGSAESDVFSFALILYELVVGQPWLPLDHSKLEAAKLIVVDDYRPQIPDYVLPDAKALIEDCWVTDPKQRLTFGQIVLRLEKIEYKLIAGVNSAKVSAFVKKIEDWTAEEPEVAVPPARWPMSKRPSFSVSALIDQLLAQNVGTRSVESTQ